MNSLLIKLLLLTCIVLQQGCGLKFKRKAVDNNMNQIKVSEAKIVNLSENNIKTPSIKNGYVFNKNDMHIIKTYYTDVANEMIRQDMISHTELSKKQNSTLVSGAIISRNIQVMPLPLKLENRLSSLSLNVLRVQIGEKIILMNVKSRKILDIINI